MQRRVLVVAGSASWPYLGEGLGLGLGGKGGGGNRKQGMRDET